MVSDSADRRCQQCGGVGEPTESGGVTTIECTDCGNVLGLARSSPETGGDDAAADTSAADAVGTVTAVDGEFDQLRRLLCSREEPVTASELRVELSSSTLSVTVDGGQLRIETADD